MDVVTIWTVWYEDRFGTGADRDPASIVALFLEKDDAKNYIDTHEGPVNIQLGKFDGLFLKEWSSEALIAANLVTPEDLLRLIKMNPPAKLIKHWEKGWI